MNPAANGSVRVPCKLEKLPTNSALETFHTIQSAIFVYSYSCVISVPLMLHWVYGQ